MCNLAAMLSNTKNFHFMTLEITKNVVITALTAKHIEEETKEKTEIQIFW